VPFAIKARSDLPAEALAFGEPREPSAGIITLEIGSDALLRVPGEVPVDRVAAMVRALGEVP
jgi:transposase